MGLHLECVDASPRAVVDWVIAYLPCVFSCPVKSAKYKDCARLVVFMQRSCRFCSSLLTLRWGFIALILSVDTAAHAASETQTSKFEY